MKLVERMARALAIEDSGPDDSALFLVRWGDYEEEYMQKARAALESIRGALKQIIMDEEPYAGPYVHDICRRIDDEFDRGYE